MSPEPLKKAIRRDKFISDATYGSQKVEGRVYEAEEIPVLGLLKDTSLKPSTGKGKTLQQQEAESRQRLLEKLKKRKSGEEAAGSGEEKD